MAQSSSSQGRLEQQLSERNAAVKDRDEKVVMLERKLAETETQAQSLMSCLNEHETLIADRDQQINELKASIDSHSRFDGTYCFGSSDIFLSHNN